MVKNRFNINTNLFHRLRKLYKKPERKDNDNEDDESIKAVIVLNQDLIPDFHSASMELNLARKLSPHISTFTPLHFAILSDVTINEFKASITKENINAVAYNCMTALHLALCLKLNPFDVVNCLIERGADVNCRMTSYQFTPLLIAVYTHRHEILRLLIENGADVNAGNDEGLTPLILASALGNEDIVKILIDKGARLDCRLKSTRFTPLHLASMKIDGVFLRKIIRSNDDETTILDMEKTRIIEESRERILMCLLDNGANIQAKDVTGKTALHFAVQQENLCAETLLRYGAEVNVRDDEGKLALHYAIDNRRGCNLECLLKYNADIYDVGKIDRLAFRKTIEGDNTESPIVLVFDAHVNGVYEICRISRDRAAIFQDLLEHCILEYLVKMEAANLHVSDNSKTLIDEIGFDKYYFECLNEVRKMKLYKVKRNFSLYDLLHMKPKHRARLMKRCSIPVNFEARFPIYWDVFQASFCKGKKKRKLLTGKKFSWYWITNGEVPDIYVKNAPERSNQTLNVMSSYWYRSP